MPRIQCCYGCVPPKRHIGCHGTCTDYIKASKKNEQRKAELLKARQEQFVYLSHLTSVLAKEKKRG